MNKTTYKGVTREVSDNLFTPTKITKNKPRKSYKFDSLSLYYDGIYWFPNDIRETSRTPRHFRTIDGIVEVNSKPFEVQGVYYQGKWRQDTFYIANDFKEMLLYYAK